MLTNRISPGESDSTPNAKEVDPRLVFERLFGNGTSKEQEAQRQKREQYNKSILDFVREDARTLSGQLGATRPAQTRRISNVGPRTRTAYCQGPAGQRRKPNLPPGIKAPTGIPKDVVDHIRLMSDLMILAFQADLTRVVTFPFANDGSGKPYPFLTVKIGDKEETVREGHHDLSHHGNDKNKHAKIRRINRFHIEQVAYILGKMKSIKEGDKTLLEQSTIVYGSGIGDGNRHNHDDLPILVAGKGGGTLKTGQHIKYPKDTPLMNLYLAMFHAWDARQNRSGIAREF